MISNQTHRSSQASGYTLVEAMIGVVIFTVVIVSVTAGLLSTRKAAEANVYQSSIISVVTGFIEQTKAHTYSELEDFATGVTSEIEYIISSSNNATIYNDTETVLQIPIDADDEGNISITVDLHVRIRISPLTDLEAVQVDILYAYEMPLSDRIYNGSVSTIISEVPTF